MSDRLAGAIILIFAVWYGLEAFRLKPGFGFSALGPKDFPLLLAVVLVITASAIFLRPDPEPEWPALRPWADIGLLLVSFVGYAYMLVPVGFVIATTLETGFVSQRFGAKPLQALLVGLISSFALYALFVYALKIPLPIGRVFTGR